MAMSDADRETIATERVKAMQKATEAFEQLDLDSNGLIERSEINKVSQESLGIPATSDPAQREAKIKEFFDTFDANGDGKISKEEWLDFFGKLFDSVIEAGLAQ